MKNHDTANFWQWQKEHRSANTDAAFCQFGENYFFSPGKKRKAFHLAKNSRELSGKTGKRKVDWGCKGISRGKVIKFRYHFSIGFHSGSKFPGKNLIPNFPSRKVGNPPARGKLDILPGLESFQTGGIFFPAGEIWGVIFPPFLRKKNTQSCFLKIFLGPHFGEFWAQNKGPLRGILAPKISFGPRKFPRKTKTRGTRVPQNLWAPFVAPGRKFSSGGRFNSPHGGTSQGGSHSRCVTTRGSTP